MKQSVKMFFLHGFRLLAAAVLFSILGAAACVTLGYVAAIAWSLLVYGFNLRG
jgi:hypothetical protein